MKIGLCGVGNMGSLLTQIAPLHGAMIVPLSSADVYIDFSHPDVVLKHIAAAAKAGIPIVIGTTGWEKEIPQAQILVQQSGIGAIFSPNFSIGMALFLQLLQRAQALLPDYALSGVEHHHRHKQDAPSGTAKMIASLLEMHTPFVSIRSGECPGRHTLTFDSPCDSITLTHEAHNREGFARGALTAAAWIKDKIGWYTLDDMLGTLHSAHHPL